MATMFLGSGLARFLKIKNLSVDGTVFKLHYKFTAVVLFGASLMVTGYQFFGNPIDCIMQRDPSDAKYKRFVETLCWIEGTYSLPKAYDKKIGVKVVYPGVGNYEPGDEVVEHAYYQWVCLTLLLQSVLFLLPHLIWKVWEGGRIRQLLLELDNPILEEESRMNKYSIIADYFFTRTTGHKLYFLKYIICECLNFVNVIGQIYLVDKFLHGEFTKYGREVISFLYKDQQDRTDPMIKVFPRITKCLFHNYGPSGDVQLSDVFCVLPLNILNEKIYVFIWFWFLILAILTSISLALGFLRLVWPQARIIAMRYACLLVDETKLEKVLDRCSTGDWFVLYMLAKSMDKANFKELIDAMDKPILNDLTPN